MPIRKGVPLLVPLELQQLCAAVVDEEAVAEEEVVVAGEAVAAHSLIIAHSMTWSQRTRMLVVVSATTKTFHPWDRDKQTASSKVDRWEAGSRATVPTCRIIISRCGKHQRSW